LTRRELDREQLRFLRQSQYAEGVRLVREFAVQNGLDVRDVDVAKRRVRLSGTAARLAAAFGTRLNRYRAGDRLFHSYDEALRIPDHLAPWVRAALGFDTRPRLRARRLRSYAVGEPAGGGPPGNGLWPAEMASLYGIEAPRQGLGQRIAIIAPRGGFRPEDLPLAFKNSRRTDTTATEVKVDTGSNRFGLDQAADQELALDLQVAGAVAPAASLFVYFTHDSEQGLSDAVLAAVHDDTHRPDVISISWGAAESEWASYKPALDVLNGALADAVALKLPVMAAAGDFLATDGVDDDLVHVSYPASSPYALACGGTRIALAADGKSIASEVVWNDGTYGTGGGVSEMFDVPDFQQTAGVPPSFSTQRIGRGVPDVSAAASFINGYKIVVNGKEMVQGGTSAVAPLWAALLALIKAETEAPLGRIHPMLYADAAFFRRVSTGNNKYGPLGYDARDGWNACCGLGAPVGRAFFATFAATS
jgi:kumamolisin